LQEIGGPVEIWRPEGWLRALRCLGTGAHCYNVQITVDTEHRAQLANMAKQAKGALKTETLEAVADRGYFSGPEILACHEAGITVTLPKPQASGAKSEQFRQTGHRRFSTQRSRTIIAQL
jgi:hypothetical protein